jgi:hypothetical protein
MSIDPNLAPEYPEKPKNDNNLNSSGSGVTDSTPSGVNWYDNNQTRVIAAVGLIALGALFLLQQFGIFASLFTNWWALFILFPALGLLNGAYTSYRHTGTWSSQARGQIIGGAAVLLTAMIFLFGLDWGKAWPLYIVVAGVAMLVR